MKVKSRSQQGPQKNRNNIEVGAKLFAVLEYVASEHAHNNAVPVREMARALPIARSTLHRVLHTLEGLGYIETAEKAHYRLAAKFYALTEPATHFRKLLSVARSVMVELMVRFSETVNLGVLDEGQVSYIDVIESPNSLRTAANAGDRNPLHSTSLGKALLAFMPDDEVDTILESQPLIKRTSRTITQKRHFSEHLASVREQGVAFDLQENMEGVTCVAAPIFDQRGRVVAAISVSGPTTRMESKVPALRETVKAAGIRISRMLGLRTETSGNSRSTKRNSQKSTVSI